MGDTVDSPRAVMIHFRYTSAKLNENLNVDIARNPKSPLTNFAMMCSGWLDGLTLPTPPLTGPRTFQT